MPALRGDVETIVGKALEKDRERRYASAEELASDVRRFLDHQPIVARAPTTLYQLRKFARRNRVLVGAVAAVFAALLAGLIVSARQYLRAEERGRQLAEALETATRAEQATAAALAQEREARDAAERERARAEDARSELEESERYFDGLFASASPVEQGDEVRVVDVLERTTGDIDTAFRERPLLRARLLQRVGNTWREIGHAQRALPFLEEARTIRVDEGSSPPGVLVTLELDLARALQNSERYEDCLEPYRSALARLAGLDTAPDPTEVRAHNGMAQALTLLSRLDEAEAEAGIALEHARALEAAGAERLAQPTLDDLIARATETLAAIRWQDGRAEEADALVQEALRRREAIDPTAWETATTMQLAGQIASSLGRDDEAEALIQRSLELARVFVHGDHPGILARMNGLGLIRLRRGRFEEALALLQDALAMCERLHGSPSHMHGVILGYLGSTYNRMQDRARAVELFERSVAELREAQAGTLDLASNLSNLATVLTRLRRFAEAEPLILEAIELRVAAAGPNHARVGLDYGTLAEIRDGLGDREGALEARSRSQSVAEARADESRNGSGPR